MKNELSSLYKVTNKYIKKDYTKYRVDIIERHLQHTGSTKKVFEELRMNNTWIEGLRKQDRTLCKQADIINAASDFYKKFYRDKIQNNNISNIEEGTDENYIKPVDKMEVIEEAIKSFELEKSPGPDIITNVTLRLAHKTVADPLVKLFNLILQNSETSIQCSESDIILIYKKGDPKDIGNYSQLACYRASTNSYLHHK